MRRLEVREPEIMRIAIQNEILRSEESRYDHRLHGLLLVASGLSCYQTARLLGQAPRTVEYWVVRFEAHGFAGLQEGHRSGRPTKLHDEVLRAVGIDLRKEPRSLGYPQTLWDGKLLSHHLKRQYDIDLGVRQCQRLFHQLGFRRRKPRALIAQSDPKAQEAYKKNSDF